MYVLPSDKVSVGASLSATRVVSSERVSIIIPVRNEEKNIRLLLPAILGQSAHFDEVVVTDGTSSDRTREIIEECRAADVRVILAIKPNSTCGEGRNHSIRHASGEICVFLDAGMIPDRDWLERLLECFASDPSADFIFGRTVFDLTGQCAPQTFFQRVAGCLSYPGPGTWVKTVPGSGMRRRLWERWGQLPEARVGEDLLLFHRLEQERIAHAYCPDAVVRYYDFPETPRALWKKRFISVKVVSQFTGMRSSLLRRLVRDHGVLLALAPVLLLGMFRPALLPAALLALFATRTILLVRRHPDLLSEFGLIPRFWLTSILAAATLDCARICGFLAAGAESVRWQSRKRRQYAVKGGRGG